MKLFLIYILVLPFSQTLLLTANPLTSTQYSSDLYNQEKLLNSKNYKKSTSKKQQKISYFLHKKNIPLRNRIIAWGAVSAVWVISTGYTIWEVYKANMFSKEKYAELFPDDSECKKEKNKVQLKLTNLSQQLSNLSLTPTINRAIQVLYDDYTTSNNLTVLNLHKTKKTLKELELYFADIAQEFNDGHLKNDFPLYSLERILDDTATLYPSENREIIENFRIIEKYNKLISKKENLSTNIQTINAQIGHILSKRLNSSLLTLVSAVLSAPLIYLAYRTFNNTYQAIANRYWDRTVDPLEPLEKKYILKKEKLPHFLQNKIEELFALVRTDPSKLKEVQKFLNTALSIPKKNIKINYNDKKIEELLKGYPSTIKIEITDFIFYQLMTQQALHSKNSTEAPRVPFYFQGVPGSGKTRLTELIAKTLQLPFAHVSLEGASISDLQGRSLNSVDPTPGLILEALTQAKINDKTAKNTILFIDEADRVINNSKSEILPFLLKLLEPNSKSFFNPYLNTHIDTSNLIIILAGNYKIKDKALQNRFNIIHFNGFPTDYKKQIIWDNALNRICKSYSINGKYSIHMDDFTPEEKEEINTLIEMDKDPGFRTIEKILWSYVSHKIRNKYSLNHLSEKPNFKEKIQILNKQL